MRSSVVSSADAGHSGVEEARVVVVDHRDSYTWNLAHLIASVTGQIPTVLEHDKASLEELAAYSHVVLSPGPGHPDEYDWSVLDLGKPVLGVCLGMQGIVRHLGGIVERVAPAHGDVAVIGHDGQGAFLGLPQGFGAVRYHSLAATVVPGDLRVTARSEDSVVQGVRHRELPIEGVQFHPESILSEYGPELIANFLYGRRLR